uniref:WD repeat domain-containing protein 83 n=1 Tax=Sinocyclocheilus grahami TaxID=75366 RepID=A0A672MHK4_SINGR
MKTTTPMIPHSYPTYTRPEEAEAVDCGIIKALLLSTDGNYVLTCGSDKSLKLWSVSRGTLLKTYTGHGYEVLDVDRYDNSQLCSCSSDKTVILWDVVSGQVTLESRSHYFFVIQAPLIWTVRCWDTRSRRMEPIQILDEARDGISSLKVSEHELLTGELYHTHEAMRTCPITCVCFSRDGQCTLSSSLDSTVRLLDKSSGEMLGEYSGHVNKDYKLDCCLSDKDTRVLSWSEDGHVYFWDLVEGSLTLKLPVGKAVVQSLSFHPTEPRLLTAMEGRVQVWGAEPEDAAVE